MDFDITRSSRNSGGADQSLILPACKGISPTLITRYFLVYSFYIAKYSDKNSKKDEYRKYFFELLENSANEPGEKEMVEKLKSDIQKESN